MNVFFLFWVHLCCLDVVKLASMQLSVPICESRLIGIFVLGSRDGGTKMRSSIAMIMQHCS